VGLDGGITGGELPLIRVEALEVLLEDEDVLDAVVAGEGGGDLGRGGPTARVAMPSELLRVPVAGHNVAEDPQAGAPRDVTDHQRELHVHLDQGFLHALDCMRWTCMAALSINVARWRR
jgi:hypothetical protein